MTNRARNSKRFARFGPKWWDRNGHISFWRRDDPVWKTWGADEFDRAFQWPRPCVICNTEGDTI